MQRFKRGEAVWLFRQDEFGYPQLHHRPAIVTKRVHRLSYFCTFVAHDPRRPCEEWKLDRRGHQYDPRDMLPYSKVQPWEDNHSNAIDHLRELRAEWGRTVEPEKKAAWLAAEKERQRASDAINRRLLPILARIMGAVS